MGVVGGFEYLVDFVEEVVSKHGFFVGVAEGDMMQEGSDANIFRKEEEETMLN
jgi:hypothetical protein